MACSNLTTGKNAKSACKIQGGVSTVYLANADMVASVGTTGADETEAINAIVGTAGATGFFYEFGQIQETSSFSMTPNSSIPNGSLFYETLLNLTFTDYNASLRYTIKTLTENNLVGVVVLKTGEYVYLGQDGGLDINGGSGSSGILAGDKNGFDLIFRGVESAPPLTLDAAFIASTDWTDLLG